MAENYIETDDLIFDLVSKQLKVKPHVEIMPVLGLDEDEEPDIETVGENQAAIMKHLNGGGEVEEPEITVLLPTTVKVIPYYAFGMCENLKEILIPDDSNLEVIQRSAFYRCGLKKINLENSKVRELGQQCFQECLFEHITLPETLVKIGNNVFWNCEELISVGIPASLEELGESCFLECISLKVLDLSNTKVEVIPQTCFAASGVETVIFPQGLKRLNDSVFESCHYLKELELLDSVTHIGDSVFSNCAALKYLKVCDSLTHVDPDAIKSDTFLFSSGELVIDMGILRDNRHNFPEEFASFIPFTRMALLDVPTGIHSGTCHVERIYGPGQTVPNQRIIHCRNILRPVVLSTLSGESYEVDITTARMDDSLKTIAVAQNPELQPPTGWDINLDHETITRDDITVGELMDMSLSVEDFYFTIPIMVNFKAVGESRGKSRNCKSKKKHHNRATKRGKHKKRKTRRRHRKRRTRNKKYYS